MKKVSFIILTLALLIVFIVSNFSSVSAVTIVTDHFDAYGQTVIDIEGHPKIIVIGNHIDSSPLGSGDVIRITLPIVVGPKTYYLPIAVFTDIPGRISQFQWLYNVYSHWPTSIQLVDSSDIEVRREGKSKTVMIVWKTALVVPDEYWPELVPGMSIPPGRIILRGHGDSFYGSQIAPVQNITWTGYNGNATFVCPTWDFGGPVGVDEGPYQTGVRLDGTITTISLT